MAATLSLVFCVNGIKFAPQKYDDSSALLFFSVLESDILLSTEPVIDY